MTGVILSGPFLAAAALLVLAGLSKVADPQSLVRALRSVGLALPAGAVRLAAAGEAVLGVVAVLTGGRVAAALVALSYAGFTAFVLLALGRGGVLASCGCFGKQDTPPTRTHAVLTGAVAVLAVGVAVRPHGSLMTVVDGGGVALLLASAAVAVTLYLALALLPMLTTRPAGPVRRPARQVVPA